MNTPHCTISTRIAGMASERKVKATTMKIDTAVSSVINSCSLPNPDSISSTIILFPMRWYSPDSFSLHNSVSPFTNDEVFSDSTGSLVVTVSRECSSPLSCCTPSSSCFLAFAIPAFCSLVNRVENNGSEASFSMCFTSVSGDMVLRSFSCLRLALYR